MTNPIELWRGTRNPFRELTQLQRAMERVFDDPSWLSRATGSENALAFNPSCEVTEDKNHYYFKFDLPGLNKDLVKVEIHENQLTVSGERREEKKEDSKKYHFSEVSYGNFVRSFTLPLAIDTEKVEAKFDNGVLNVAVAKTETTKARQVSIK